MNMKMQTANALHIHMYMYTCDSTMCSRKELTQADCLPRDHWLV